MFVQLNLIAQPPHILFDDFVSQLEADKHVILNSDVAVVIAKINNLFRGQDALAEKKEILSKTLSLLNRQDAEKVYYSVANLVAAIHLRSQTEMIVTREEKKLINTYLNLAGAYSIIRDSIVMSESNFERSRFSLLPHGVLSEFIHPYVAGGKDFLTLRQNNYLKNLFPLGRPERIFNKTIVDSFVLDYNKSKSMKEFIEILKKTGNEVRVLILDNTHMKFDRKRGEELLCHLKEILKLCPNATSITIVRTEKLIIKLIPLINKCLNRNIIKELNLSNHCSKCEFLPFLNFVPDSLVFPLLEKLSLTMCDEIDPILLCDILRLPSLKFLDLSRTTISDAAMWVLCDEEPKNLEILELSGTNFNLKYFLQYSVNSYEKVTQLNIGNNYINYDDLIKLAHSNKFPALKDLAITVGDISFEKENELFKAFKERGLITLHLISGRGLFKSLYKDLSLFQ